MSDRVFENLGWFFAGLMVGGVVGLLYAPESGEDTRKKIVETSKVAKSELIKKVDDLRKTIGDTIKTEDEIILEEEK